MNWQCQTPASVMTIWIFACVLNLLKTINQKLVLSALASQYWLLGQYSPILQRKQKFKYWQVLSGVWHWQFAAFLNPYDFTNSMTSLFFTFRNSWGPFWNRTHPLGNAWCPFRNKFASPHLRYFLFFLIFLDFFDFWSNFDF